MYKQAEYNHETRFLAIRKWYIIKIYKLAPLLRHTGGRFLHPSTSGCAAILYHAGRCNASHFLREFGA